MQVYSGMVGLESPITSEQLEEFRKVKRELEQYRRLKVLLDIVRQHRGAAIDKVKPPEPTMDTGKVKRRHYG